MTKKMKKESGFTLVEMLIVVAIIAILIAVSIPMVTGALDRAKEATDAANVRAAKAQMTIAYLSEDTDALAGKTMAYDAEKGTLEEVTATVNVYGKVKDNTDNIIFVKYDTTDNVVKFQSAVPGAEPTGTWKTTNPGVTSTT